MSPALLLAALTLFEGVRVITGDGAVIEDAVLVVRDGVIESVGPSGATLPPGASRVSLQGKTLMPLLVDIHGDTAHVLHQLGEAVGNLGVHVVSCPLPFPLRGLSKLVERRREMCAVAVDGRQLPCHAGETR